jgi:hypothetical protein
MKELFKTLFFKYQKAFFYVNQFGAEISKPMRFYSESILLILFLASIGLKAEWYMYVIMYIVILVIAAAIGYALTKTGVVAYNNELANKQNNELSEILDRVRSIENWQQIPRAPAGYNPFSKEVKTWKKNKN